MVSNNSNNGVATFVLDYLHLERFEQGILLYRAFQVQLGGF